MPRMLSEQEKRQKREKSTRLNQIQKLVKLGVTREKAEEYVKLIEAEKFNKQLRVCAHRISKEYPELSALIMEAFN
jgi:hypothetical protein